ncbi:MAG: PorP/SprF family type IX secretion system membrane protein [Chitinophagales bacterium]
MSKFFVQILLLLTFRATIIVAQDIHFSQFYTDAIRLQPAATGNFAGDYRVGLNAKSQWETVAAPYRTISAFADFGLLKRQKRKSGADWLGLGFNVLHDYAGDGNLSMTEVRGSAAFHQSFTPQFYVSLGAAAAYTQRSFDYEKLLFGSQWNEVGFDNSISSLENFSGEKASYLDLSGGAMFSYHQVGIFDIYGGFSALHLNQPKFSFFGSENERLGIRYIANVGGSVRIKQFSVEPALYVSRQKRASELVLGSNVAWVWNDGNRYKAATKLYVGTWYRYADAVVLLGGVAFRSYRFLVSYDINVSALQVASQKRGGLEISLVHVGGLGKEPTVEIYCPRF